MAAAQDVCETDRSINNKAFGKAGLGKGINMTVSNRLVIAFVSISVFVLALMGIAWVAMSDVLSVLQAGSLTVQQ